MKRKLNLVCTLLGLLLVLCACSTRETNLQGDTDGRTNYENSKVHESADENEKVKPSESFQSLAPLESTSPKHNDQSQIDIPNDSQKSSFPGKSSSVQSGEEIMSDNSIAVKAELLTDHIINYVLDPNIVNNAANIDDYAIYRFIVSLLMYTDNPNYPYSSIVSVDDDGYACFPLSKVQKVASEVFGKTNWFLDNSDFDPESKDYRLMTGFGIGGTYSYKDLNIKISDDEIVNVNFILTSSEGKEFGSYLINYQIISEKDRIFLQYLSFEKIK